jgi:Flp pilus assembly pilin Flp
VPRILSFAQAGRTLQRGQGMTEYIIIVALIAVAAIAVYQFFGNTIRHQTAAIAMEVSGQKAGGEIGQAQSTANEAVTEAARTKGLDDFTNDSAHKSGGN